MHFQNKHPALLASLVLASSSAMAGTTIGCPPGWVPADLDVRATVTFTGDCPLLEDGALFRLVKEFGPGTEFAYPNILGTCVSGTLDPSYISMLNFGRTSIEIDPDASFSRSAQRLLPVPNDQGFPLGTDFNPDTGTVSYLDGSPNLFAWSGLYPSLQAGAAMTVLHLEGRPSDSGGRIKLDVVLDDHFLLDAIGNDTEDFTVIGSKGNYAMSGRLTGNASPNADGDLEFVISGNVCLK